MSVPYAEIRPAFTAETPYALALTVDGTGSLTTEVYTATLNNPDGTPAAGTPSVAVTDAANRVITATFPGQSGPGLFRFTVRRTDDGSGLVVGYGVVEVTDPAAC